MGQALITCCKINFPTNPGCSCFSCFQQKTLSVEQINSVQPYLRFHSQLLHSSVSTQLAAISTSAMHPCQRKLMPAGLEGESQSLCIVLLLQRSGLAGLNWLWWEQERVAPVSHPTTAFLSSSLSMCNRSQASVETQGESNGCELPCRSGTTWGNNQPPGLLQAMG